MKMLSEIKLIDKIKRVGIFQTIDDLFGNRFQHLIYLYCQLSNKVYFGSYLAATQGKSIRHFYMDEMVSNYCKNNTEIVKILEVGSWAGGSAITWAEAIKKYARCGMVFCIDSWTDYLDSAKDKQWTHKTMKKAFQNNKIYKLFLHNILVSKHSDIVSILRGSSDEILPMLNKNQFDLVFIDGNHSFEFIYNDINNSAPLVKDGGVLCGDDLELQYNEIDTDNAIELKDQDVIVDPLTNKRFHPGVSLAVYKYFKKDMSSWEGFWGMQKDGDNWKSISMDIELKEVAIPEHLR